MPLYRPRPGRHLYRHVGGVVEFETKHGWGSFDVDDDDDFVGPPTTLEDLGGAFVSSPDGQRVEVDQIFPTSPVVIESTSTPPFGEWQEVDEIDVPDPDTAWDAL